MARKPHFGNLAGNVTYPSMCDYRQHDIHAVLNENVLINMNVIMYEQSNICNCSV
jgi:C4-type Zn-finger protein